MTLIIRAISYKRTVYISDGRKSNSNGIISDSINKIVIKEKNSLFAFSGVIDNETGDSNFNLIKAFENKDFDYCSNLILSRQNIVETIINEYNKDFPATIHKCHLMYSIICQEKIINENIVVMKNRYYSIYHLKNSILPLLNINNSVSNLGVRFNSEYIDFMNSGPQILKDFIIDFNHLYNEDQNSMSLYFKHVIPHLFLQSIYKVVGNNLSIETFNSLSQNNIDEIGHDFFIEFNKINIDQRIGSYQMGKNFEL